MNDPLFVERFANSELLQEFQPIQSSGVQTRSRLHVERMSDRNGKFTRLAVKLSHKPFDISERQP